MEAADMYSTAPALKPEKKNLPSYSLPLSQADRWCSPSNVKLKPYNLAPIGAASVHEKKICAPLPNLAAASSATAAPAN